MHRGQQEEEEEEKERKTRLLWRKAGDTEEEEEDMMKVKRGSYLTVHCVPALDIWCWELGGKITSSTTCAEITNLSTDQQPHQRKTLHMVT